MAAIESAPGRKLRPLAHLACLLCVLSLVAATPVQAEPRPPEPPQRSLLAAAFGAMDGFEFDRARKIGETLGDPLARKVVRWYTLVQQRTGGNFDDYVSFIDQNPDWPWQYTLQHRAESALTDDTPREKIRAFFADREPVSPAGVQHYVDLLMHDGRDEEARALLRESWIEHDFLSSEERRLRERYGHFLDKKLERQRLDRLLWDGHFYAAERQARRVGEGHRALARARAMLARTTPGVDAAIERVPEALRDDPGLIYERARWRQRKGRYEATVELLDPPIADAPRAEVWWPVRHWAARRALDEGHISTAYRISAHHGVDRGLPFAEGEWLAGWIALRFLREPETASPHFVRLFNGVSTPVSRARGAYWAGRAEEAAGRPEEARRWYETAARYLTTFYGQLAAARLDERLFLALPEAPNAGAERRDAFERQELTRVVRLLAELGREDRVDRFVNHMANRAEDAAEAVLVAELAESVNRKDLAVRVARQARRAGKLLPDHLYPVIDIPAVATGGNDDMAALMLAIIRQESGFNTSAVSRAGARGLMQLMPATARHVSGELGLPYSRERLLSDGDYNLRLGARYMDRLIERYDGSRLLAIAAYNAGPSRVSQWLRRYGDPRTGFVDPVDWIESLPFSETRNYVQRVFEGLMIYRHRLAPMEVAMSLDDELMVRRSEPDASATGDSACCS